MQFAHDLDRNLIGFGGISRDITRRKQTEEQLKRFNEELEDVRSKVLHMGGVVEEQLANALKVLVNDERELASEVIDTDAVVNSLEVEIDEECTRIVARRQPAA